MSEMSPANPDDLRIVALSDAEILDGFTCGEDDVDRHIPKCCGWHGEYTNRTFCMFLAGVPKPIGFYCAGVVAHSLRHLKHRSFRFWQRSDYVPFVFLHYIGIHADYQGQGYGTILLYNMLSKAAYATLLFIWR